MLSRSLLTFVAFCLFSFVLMTPTNYSLTGDNNSWLPQVIKDIGYEHMLADVYPTDDDVLSTNDTRCNCSDSSSVVRVVEVIREIIVFPSVQEAVDYMLQSNSDVDSGKNIDLDVVPSFRSDDSNTSKKNRTEPARPVKKVKKLAPLKKQIALRADDDENEGDSKCVPAAACTSSADCGGDKSACIGIAVGTCNCNACISGLPCSSDAQCGGYQHACNTTRGFCNCVEAHNQNGFANLGDALLNFCSHKQCAGDKDACFGLPCHTGLCTCA